MRSIEAGPEMNAEIAERVFRLIVIELPDDEVRACADNTGTYIGGFHGRYFIECDGELWHDKKPVNPVPRYSNYTSMAWMVIEQMIQQGWTPALQFADGEWEICFYHRDRGIGVGMTAKEIAHAICLTALAARDALDAMDA